MTHEVYVVLNKDDEYLYIGSGKSGRHKHCLSGTSHVYELNKMHFDKEEYFVNVIATGLDKDESLRIEQEMILNLNPAFNKVGKKVEPDDVDFNNYEEVKRYLEQGKVDYHLLKLVLLYTQESEIARIVSNKLNRMRRR